MGSQFVMQGMNSMNKRASTEDIRRVSSAPAPMDQVRKWNRTSGADVPRTTQADMDQGSRHPEPRSRPTTASEASMIVALPSTLSRFEAGLNDTPKAEREKFDS